MQGTLQGRATAWEFVKANYGEMMKRYKDGPLFGRIFEYSASGFHSAECATEVEKVFAANPVPAATRVAAQTVEKINLNAGWLQREKEGLAKYF